MRTGFPCNESRYFPVGIDLQGFPVSCTGFGFAVCPLPPDFQTILHLCYMPVWIFTKAKMRSSPAIFYQGTIMLASSYCTKTLSSLYTYFFCTIIEGFIYTFSFPFYYFSSSFKFYSSNFTSSSICF